MFPTTIFQFFLNAGLNALNPRKTLASMPSVICCGACFYEPIFVSVLRMRLCHDTPFNSFLVISAVSTFQRSEKNRAALTIVFFLLTLYLALRDVSKFHFCVTMSRKCRRRQVWLWETDICVHRQLGCLASVFRHLYSLGIIHLCARSMWKQTSKVCVSTHSSFELTDLPLSKLCTLKRLVRLCWLLFFWKSARRACLYVLFHSPDVTFIDLDVF